MPKKITPRTNDVRNLVLRVEGYHADSHTIAEAQGLAERERWKETWRRMNEFRTATHLLCRLAGRRGIKIKALLACRADLDDPGGDPRQRMKAAWVSAKEIEHDDPGGDPRQRMKAAWVSAKEIEHEVMGDEEPTATDVQVVRRWFSAFEKLRECEREPRTATGKPPATTAGDDDTKGRPSPYFIVAQIRKHLSGNDPPFKGKKASYFKGRSDRAAQYLKAKGAKRFKVGRYWAIPRADLERLAPNSYRAVMAAEAPE